MRKQRWAHRGAHRRILQAKGDETVAKDVAPRYSTSLAASRSGITLRRCALSADLHVSTHRSSRKRYASSDESTPRRSSASSSEIATLLLYEATVDLPTEPRDVRHLSRSPKALA